MPYRATLLAHFLAFRAGGPALDHPLPARPLHGFLPHLAMLIPRRWRPHIAVGSRATSVRSANPPRSSGCRMRPTSRGSTDPGAPRRRVAFVTRMPAQRLQPPRPRSARSPADPRGSWRVSGGDERAPLRFFAPSMCTLLILRIAISSPLSLRIWSILRGAVPATFPAASA